MAKILVADDNSNIQKMVTLALKDQGIEVVSVGNGEAAVRKLPDLRPDLVLADIFMPVRNGYEVCEFIKRDSRYAHIPVILLVGAFDPLDQHEAQRVGANGVLKKPFIPPDPLITMVKSALSRSGAEVPAPVAAGAPTGASKQEAASAEAQSPSVEPEPPAELPVELPVTQREPIRFGGEEKPLAFQEFLQAPAAEPEPEAPRGTGFEELRFRERSQATPEVAEEPESPAWVRPEPVAAFPEELAPKKPAEFVAGESGKIIVEETASPTEVALLPELAGSAAEWMETAAAQPPAVQVPETESWSNVAPLEAEPLPSASAEPETAAWTEPTEQVAEPAVTPWSAPAAPVQAAEPVAPPAEATPPEGSVQSLVVPPPPDPQVIETVVAKVLERMQPQILEIVTREILRPVVEALVRREVEKQQDRGSR